MSESKTSDAAGLNSQQSSAPAGLNSSGSSESAAGLNDGDRTKAYSEAYNKASQKYEQRLSELEKQLATERQQRAALENKGKGADELAAEMAAMQTAIEAERRKFAERETALVDVLRGDIEARKQRLSDSARKVLEAMGVDDPAQVLKVLPSLEEFGAAPPRPAQGGITAGESLSAKDIAAQYHAALAKSDAAALRKVYEVHGKSAVDEAVRQHPRI